MILLIDNYDSFTYNLEQFLNTYAEVVVCRNDADDLENLAVEASAIVLSPGPGTPSEAGRMEEIIQTFYDQKPILGICLGHQAIGEVFGAKVVQAKNIRHGKVSSMRQTQNKLFKDLPEELPVMRYHSLSLQADSIPAALEITGWSIDDQEIMSVQHKDYPIFGLQFHPESIGTPDGLKIIENFVTLIREE